MTQSRQSSQQSGKTFIGLALGLIAGLAIAVIVALYITRGPKPLASKQTSPATEVASDASPSTPRRNLSNLIEQNDTSNESKPTAPQANARAEDDDLFDDSQIIEIPSDRNKVEKKTAPSTRAPAPSQRTPTRSTAPSSGYYLQIGAYKTQTGAEQQRAHLALQGFESKVSQRSSGNITYYRVRLGPFAALDEVNRVRQSLAQEGIDAIVIRFQKK